MLIRLLVFHSDSAIAPVTVALYLRWLYAMSGHLILEKLSASPCKVTVLAIINGQSMASVKTLKSLPIDLLKNQPHLNIQENVMNVRLYVKQQQRL